MNQRLRSPQLVEFDYFGLTLIDEALTLIILLFVAHIDGGDMVEIVRGRQ